MIPHTITDQKKVCFKTELQFQSLGLCLYRQGKLYFKTAFKCHLKAIQIKIDSSHAQNSTKKMKNSEPEVSLHDYKLHTAATKTVNE